MAFWERPRALQGPIASKSGPLEGPSPLAPRNWWTLEKPLAPLLKGHWVTGPSRSQSAPGGGASNIQHHTTSYNIHTTSIQHPYNIQHLHTFSQ